MTDGRAHADFSTDRTARAERLLPLLSQLVLHVIWQTWKDTTPGAQRFEGMNSLVQLNPEYDYALFTDEDCQRFMCELADPDARRAYEACSVCCK